MKNNTSKFIYVMRKIIYGIACIDYGFKKLTRLFIRTRYVRVGACNQCGKCCESIGFEVDRGWLKFEWLIQMMIRWGDKIHNMSFKQIDSQGEHPLMLFKCNYLGEDGLCQNYENRPLFCRTYPQVFHYFLQPSFYPDCSYRSILRSDLKAYRQNPEKFLN